MNTPQTPPPQNHDWSDLHVPDPCTPLEHLASWIAVVVLIGLAIGFVYGLLRHLFPGHIS